MAKLYCVGVGAGDGGYITLGALRALEKADVIAAPVKRYGEKSTALEIIKKEFNINKKKLLEIEFPMTSDKSVRGQSRKTAADRIISELKRGETVAMITLGDVSVYSTCSYVIGEVHNAGFETEVIAGVPSFCAAADKAQLSLCEGNESFAVIPSVNTDKIERYIEDFDTLVIMKAGRSMDEICSLLKKHGLFDSAFVCSNIGMENETIEKINSGKSYSYFTTVIVKKNIDKIRAK